MKADINQIKYMEKIEKRLREIEDRLLWLENYAEVRK